MRYFIIICLISYIFNLKLDSIKNANSFDQLYSTCDNTLNKVTELNAMVNIQNSRRSKLSFCRKNNAKLLYNYRICTASK